ncbi:ATP synthase subunit I [Paludibacterium paludis]|uniref:ATP synthase protein I n=1 Tax=Paludibacterium paludis TaxID=1225769 RepID=A0A918P263_9NEIS|nr:ATP synthase subunit I [Paludibacterium paludis]GGY15201.1 hypothetical protein GCM10011289_17980 [Paludibacterium paludis]
MVYPEVKRIVRLQARLVVVAALLGVALGGASFALPVSILIGGLAGIVPALVYIRIAYARRHVPPSELMRAHFKGEAAKFILTLVMFGAAMAFFKDLSVAGLFGGYLATVAGYWFGLLIKN